MKKIKCLILLIILLVGFVCEVETFQSELWCFNDAYFRNASFKCETEEERVQFLNDIEIAANKNEVGVFITDMKIVDMHNYELSIFCNEYAKEAVMQETNIKQEQYNSLISGNTKVQYYDFAKSMNYANRYISSISFTGDEQAIENLYQKIQMKHKLTYPQIGGGSDRDVVYVVWCLVAIITVLFTVMVVVFNKKEVVVRISLGESVWKIIGKNILYELILDLGLFYLVRQCVFYFWSGQFMQMQIFGIYVIGIAISCCIYMSYAIYDMKQAFANSTNLRPLLGILYVVKMLVSCITIIGVVFNFSYVIQNRSVLDKDNYVENYKNYSYVYLYDMKTSNSQVFDEVDLAEREYRWNEQIPQIMTDIYLEYYMMAKPIVCVEVLSDTSSYIVVNEYGRTLINDFVDMDEYEGDILVFVPKKENEIYVRDIANEEIDLLVGNSEKVDVRYMKYSGNKNFSYIMRSASTGIGTTSNPVIIYIKNSNLSKNMNIASFNQDILFQLSAQDVEEVNEKYCLEENGYRIIVSGFLENYKYYQGFIKKMLGLSSSFAVILLAILILVIVIINTLEYQINAMALAVKKVLGYGVYEKNKKTLLLCVLTDILITIILIGYMLVMGRAMLISSVILVGLVIIGIEFLICLFNIFRIEKKSIVKILKGGCL